MKKLIVFTLMALMVEFLFVGTSMAADPNRPKFDPNTFRGRIVVEKDTNGVITAVKLESRRMGIYNIVLDEKGKELAEKMADKFVVVTGTVAAKDNVKWLTVTKYIEMQRPQGRRDHDPNRPRGPHGPNSPGEGGK